MTLQTPPADQAPPKIGALARMARGWRGRCPDCGQGKLFRSYLKPVVTCERCGHALGEYRADDGPAYFTIVIVGHLLIAPLLALPLLLHLSIWVALPIALVSVTIATLLLLPRIKGAFIGLMMSHGIRGEEHGPESEFSAST